MAALFDLHCDTLTRDQYHGSSGRATLDTPSFHLALSKMPSGTAWAQCFAIFIPDRLRGNDAIDFFDHYAESYHSQMAAQSSRAADCRSFDGLKRAMDAGKFAGLLTVEGGCVLAGKLERVQAIHDAGVRMLTLTWNGQNEIGSGHTSKEGLTSFGREAVAALENAGIVVDVSHLNDQGFEDLAGIAKKPFVASHSNARAVTPHHRNLPDAFIKEIVSRGGLIGLNFAIDFLADFGRGGGIDDVLRHTDHFLELGAEHCLAIGSDYDGTDIHPDLDSVEKALRLRDAFIHHGIPPETADGILFNNAWRFFERWL